MAEELRSSARHPLVAAVDVFELRTGAHISARTSDLSLAGCYVDTLNPLPLGTGVKVQITHENGIFTIAGTVVHSTPNLGMGIKFSELNQLQQDVLKCWFDNLSLNKF